MRRRGFRCQQCHGAEHDRPSVHRTTDGYWWAVAYHLTWVDATAFGDWDSALEHGLMLSWRSHTNDCVCRACRSAALVGGR